MTFSHQLILKYFPDITPGQMDKFGRLQALYEEWNAKINVISRKDMENFYLHHVLHSLAIAKVIRFVPGTKILDVGTGGGFPGIPLAILFPDVQFLLVDSIGKKITVVSEIARALQPQEVLEVAWQRDHRRAQFGAAVPLLQGVSPPVVGARTALRSRGRADPSPRSSPD